MSEISFYSAIGLLSLQVGAIGMSATADVKKIVANFSIVHMAAIFSVITNASCLTEFPVTFSWNHHSLITCGIFLIIGFIYASSASRLTRFFFNGNFFLISSVLLLWTFSSDFPWTSNSLVELSFLSVADLISSGVLVATFLVFFVGFFSSFLKFSSRRNSRGLREGSLRSTRGVALATGIFSALCGFFLI